MRIRALACLAIAWLAESAQAANLVELQARGEQSIDGIRQVTAEIRSTSRFHLLDLRRRTEQQDFEQWAFPPSRVARIEELVAAARKAPPARAELALEEAYDLAVRGVDIMEQISDYWRYAVRMPLREHWKTFTAANGHTSVLDTRIFAHEKNLLNALSAGDFRRAAELGRIIENTLWSATDRAAGEIIEKQRGARFEYTQRSTPCLRNDFRGEDKSVPRMHAAANPDDFFPASSRRRGELGKVVVRARIAPSNCATAFAVVVRSGYPALDAAAIKVAENSLFVAGVVGGKPQAGEMTFGVRFVYNRRSPDRGPAE